MDTTTCETPAVAHHSFTVPSPALDTKAGAAKPTTPARPPHQEVASGSRPLLALTQLEVKLVPVPSFADAVLQLQLPEHPARKHRQQGFQCLFH